MIKGLEDILNKKVIKRELKKLVFSVSLTGILLNLNQPIFAQKYKTAIPQNKEIFNLYVQDEFLKRKIEVKYDSMFTIGGDYEILWNATEEEKARDGSEYIKIRNKVGYNQKKKELVWVSGVAKEDIFKPYTHSDSYLILITKDTNPTSKQTNLIYDLGVNLVEENSLDDDEVCIGPYCETILKTADDFVFEVGKKIGLTKKQLTSLLELLDFDKYQRVNAEKEKIKIMQMLKKHDARVYYFYGENPPVDLFHLNRELAHKTKIKTEEWPYAMILVSSVAKQVGLIEFFTTEKKEKDITIGEVKAVYLINNLFPNR